MNNYHPDFLANRSDWDFYLKSYIGGRKYVSKDTLFRHAREDDVSYDLRLKRATYVNYARRVIDLYTSYIFGVETKILREVDHQRYDIFTNDVDRRGKSIDDFMRKVATFSQVFGSVGILIDAPPELSNAQTVADLSNRDLLPYCVIYFPSQIVKWSADRFGKLAEITLRETFHGDDGTEIQYRKFTKNEWFLLDKDENVISSDEHGLGEVPFVYSYFQEHPASDFIGLSMIGDIAYLNRMLMNVLSYIDEFVSKQAFPFLATAEDPVSSNDDEKVISAKNVWLYPEGATAPSYVSPPTDPADFMRNYINDVLVKEIMKSAFLDHRELAEQSGIAKQYDFHQLNHVLARFSRSLERAETEMTRLWLKWLNDSETIAIIDYPDNFNVSPLTETIENAVKIRDLTADLSPSFLSEYMLKLIQRIEPKLSDDLTESIAVELGQVSGDLFRMINEDLNFAQNANLTDQ